ncbi:MAG: hypothetical protein QM820_00780 [Minicystis sp.]
MPSIVKRAESDRLREIIGFVGIYVISGGLWAVALPHLGRARTLVEAGPPITVILVTLAVVIGAHASMRGTWRADGATPLALLDALERRHAGRRRMMRWMPWLTGAAVAGTIGTIAAIMISVGHFDADLAARTAGTGLFTIGFVWLVLRTTSRKIDRELREVAEARRLLAEDDEQR